MTSDADKGTAILPGRGIDHLVLGVRDLEQAVETYRTLGFTVTPRGDHDWGTSNQLVQLNGSFLEIITVADEGKLVEHDPRARIFSFGAFVRDILARREGCSMLVFEGQDSRSDRDEFAEKGLADLEPFDFARIARQPDGTEKQVAFSLAFVPPLETPEAAFFTCQQHAPELFWKPDYQNHTNRALAIDEVVMVAAEPEQLVPLLGGLQTPDAVSVDATGVVVETARGRVRVMTPSIYEDWYGPLAKDAPEGPHFAAIRITVSDMAALEAQLKDGPVQTLWARAGLVVPGDSLFGCALAFAQA